MPFTLSDAKFEEAQLEQMITTSQEARRVHDEFQARIALQEQLLEARKAAHLTQAELAERAGLTQQAVSRVERGNGWTISSLLKYLAGIGYKVSLEKI